MRPFLSSGVAIALQAAQQTTTSTSAQLTRSLRPAGLQSAICLRCQLRPISGKTNSSRKRLRDSAASLLRFQSTNSKSSATDSNPQNERVGAEENIARARDEDLPSHREQQRWTTSKKLFALLDQLQERLADASQRVNRYTGTDFTGIAALRQEIKDQEKLVKARRTAIEEAKVAVDAAHAQQAASQKEVVGLLERKHSWAAEDLERYMSLIRSEHANDQAVTTAKEDLRSAERSLEEARSQLERRERAQYHEEQIWSDTIRRNSTWVTFGLMGFNILLLLTSVVVIEPWRRRRLVKEFRQALNEQTEPSSTTEASSGPPTATLGAQSIPDIHALAVDKEALVDEVAEVADNPVLLDKVEETVEGKGVPSRQMQRIQGSKVRSTFGDVSGNATHWLASSFQDLFSDQSVLIRKVDLTSVAVEGLAAGAVIGALLMAMLRSR